MGHGTRFSKVPKIIGRVSGDIILFASSKRRRLETRNPAAFFSCFPFTTYEKTNFAKLAIRSFTNGFSGPKRLPQMNNFFLVLTRIESEKAMEKERV